MGLMLVIDSVAAVTVTVAEFWVVPPAPVQLSVYVEVVVGETD